MSRKVVNYYELEEKISKLVGSDQITKKTVIRELVKEFRLQISVIRRQIKLRETEIVINKKNEKKVKTWVDLPNWKDKSKCPLCNSKLVKKWEGLACQGSCPISFKIGKGWIYLQRDSGWSKSRMVINGFFGCNRRNYLQKQFAKMKRIVIVRDDYKCRKCDYDLKDDFTFERGLEVHHIIPASEEMALYLDKNNLITLCRDCHKKVHSEDKYKFGVKNE